MCAETRPAHTEIIFYYTVSVLLFQEERKGAKKREEKSLHFSGKPAIIKAQKNMDDVQRVRRKSAAEWGEKPRERVTVMPGKPDKSDTSGRASVPALTGKLCFMDGVTPHGRVSCGVFACINKECMP